MQDMPEEKNSVDAARIENRHGLGPVRDLRALASEIGLDWQRARGLWSAGLLSFDPDALVGGDEACQAEFCFLGHLARLGLSNDTLTEMMRGLRRPYAYDLSRMHYDWRARMWRLLPDVDDPEGLFFAMLGRLEASRESRVLLEIRELADDALDLARGRSTLLGHERPMRLAGTTDPASESRRA